MRKFHIFFNLSQNLTSHCFLYFCVFTCFYKFLHDMIINFFFVDLQRRTERTKLFISLWIEYGAVRYSLSCIRFKFLLFYLLKLIGTMKKVSSFRLQSGYFCPIRKYIVYPELTTLFRFWIVGLLIVARLVLVVKLDVLMIFLGPFRDILTTNHRIHEGKETIWSTKKGMVLYFNCFQNGKI